MGGGKRQGSWSYPDVQDGSSYSRVSPIRPIRQIGHGRWLSEDWRASRKGHLHGRAQPCGPQVFSCNFARKQETHDSDQGREEYPRLPFGKVGTGTLRKCVAGSLDVTPWNAQWYAFPALPLLPSRVIRCSWYRRIPSASWPWPRVLVRWRRSEEPFSAGAFVLQLVNFEQLFVVFVVDPGGILGMNLHEMM